MRLTPLWSLAVMLLTGTVLALTVHQIFAALWGGTPLYTASFLYLLIGLFAPVVLITRGTGPVAWYDTAASPSTRCRSPSTGGTSSPRRRRRCVR